MFERTGDRLAHRQADVRGVAVPVGTLPRNGLLGDNTSRPGAPLPGAGWPCAADGALTPNDAARTSNRGSATFTDSAFLA